ncbi:hypothetical protein, partial [Vibrio cyclitrophicus]|uniref:hypothetical protein n=1 Tax=Vibrio cyclitrophicus TaxID=47951 RepID=UPI0038B2B50F
GNTGDVTDETILDTTAASQDDGLNSIVFDDDLVNEDEADSVTYGQVEVGSTVNSIVISDGNPAKRRNGTSGSDHGGRRDRRRDSDRSRLVRVSGWHLDGDHERDR